MDSPNIIFNYNEIRISPGKVTCMYASAPNVNCSLCPAIDQIVIDSRYSPQTVRRRSLISPTVQVVKRAKAVIFCHA